MTTRAQSAALHDTAAQLSADLRQIGEWHVAARLERCAGERHNRTPGQRPWSCRGAACPWCGRALLRRWQGGLYDWAGEGVGAGDVSYVSVPLAGSGQLRDVVRSFRRALRDWCDRRGRSSRAWRAVAAGGLVMPCAGGRVAVLRVCHTGITRDEVSTAFASRWPGSEVSAEEPPAPLHTWSQADRLSLAGLRRGCEPLRVCVRPVSERRHSKSGATAEVAPLPVAFGWL